MKKLIYLGLVVMAIMSCTTGSSSDYVFQGTVGSSYAGNTIVLYDQVTELPLDSAVIDSSGHILIVGKVDSAKLSIVKMNGRWISTFVLSPDSLTLALRQGGVSGNSDNDAWSLVTQEVNQKYRDFRKKAIDLQRNNPNKAETKEQIVALIKKLSQYRLDTFKTFYEENTDNLSGDLAFLSLMKIMTPEEFAPLYKTASQKLKSLPEVKRYMESVKD